jgi:hypothetical protein
MDSVCAVGCSGLKIVVGRDVAEDVIVMALGMDSMLEHQPVLDKVAKHEAVVHVGLRAAIPVIHEWNVAFLPAVRIETSAREVRRRRDRIFFLDREIPAETRADG